MTRRSEVLIVVTLGALFAASCASAPAPEKTARPVRVWRAEPAATAETLRYSASLQPREQVAVAFKVSGYVQDILQVSGADGQPRAVQQGDVVKRGTVLARLRDDDSRERVNQARAQQAEAAASLDKARRDHERAERLYATQSLTRPDYDAANAAFEMAQARAAGARAQLETAEISWRDASLAAPMDAVVLSRSVEAGTLAAPGTVAFVIADVRRVKAVFGVPDRMVPALAPGQSLAVKAEAADTVGRISAIAPSADPQSRVFMVEVTIDNPTGALKPGMVASVIVDDGAPAAADAKQPGVPLSAVVKSGDGKYAVFVVEGAGETSTARLRPVSLGEIAGGRIRVASGLAALEPVIVSGATLLVDGEPVRIIP